MASATAGLTASMLVTLVALVRRPVAVEWTEDGVVTVDAHDPGDVASAWTTEKIELGVRENVAVHNRISAKRAPRWRQIAGWWRDTQDIDPSWRLCMSAHTL